MSVNVTVKNNIKFPKFIFQDDLEHIATRYFIPLMQDGINRGVGVDGNKFPELEPSTIARKRGQLTQNKVAVAKSALKGLVANIAGYGRQTVVAPKSKTQTMKLIGGMSSKTLIESGKLIRSFMAKRRGKSAVVVTLMPDRKKIGEYLQVDGVGKKKKQFNFFGISIPMENAAVQYMRKRINEIVKNA